MIQSSCFLVADLCGIVRHMAESKLERPLVSEMHYKKCGRSDGPWTLLLGFLQLRRLSLAKCHRQSFTALCQSYVCE